MLISKQGLKRKLRSIVDIFDSVVIQVVYAARILLR